MSASEDPQRDRAPSFKVKLGDLRKSEVDVSEPQTSPERSALDPQDNGKLDDNAPGDNTEPVYPTGVRLALICLALCATVFLVALSNTIIATAIPSITSAFDSYSDVGWYSSGEFITVRNSEREAITVRLVDVSDMMIQSVLDIEGF